MTLPRVVEPETLDGLAADDPAAKRSRRDLQRVHRFMGTVSIVVRTLRRCEGLHRPGTFRIVELGAGDGTLMLRVAQAIGPVDAAVELTLLDRLALVDESIIEAYARAGWRAAGETADVLDWALPEHDGAVPSDLIVANLFLHHFEGDALTAVLRAAGARSGRLYACEPRRARFALVAASLTGLIGANAVTREDAVLSVRAGFRDDELTTAWARVHPGWTVDEYGAGPFSHCFDARRVAA